jgi:mRNA interferase MazF
LPPSQNGLLSEARRGLDSGQGVRLCGQARASVTICRFTTHVIDAPLLRLPIEPSQPNGLIAESQLIIDKITTVSKAMLHSRVGRLGDEDIFRLNRAVLVFLGLAGAGAK